MPNDRSDILALDATPANRTFDQDGHLHVRESNISIAAVNGYLGREIPEYVSLGLDPAKLYQLYRDPAELEKATESFNGKPLVIEHKARTAADHDRSITVGAVRDPVWKAPFMTATLDVWDGIAIAGIETEDQCQLSSAYRYKAVMTPGEVDGVAYDGVMTEIFCNHVCLVENGRAGNQVIVGDSAIQITPQEKAAMAKTVAALSRSALFASGALRTYLRPKLATDARIDVVPMFAGITAKTWKADKAKLKLALDKALPKGSPLLAKDADIEDVVQMLDQLDEMVEDVDDAAVADPVVVKPAAVDADPDAETEDEKKERLAKRATAKAAADEAGKSGITKPAMDAAIATAVAKVATDTEAATVARMRALADAERFVRPWVGDLVIAEDSNTAAAVFKLALDSLGINIVGVDPSAFKTVLSLVPKPGETVARGGPSFAQDAASEEAKFRAKFPGAVKLVRS